MKELFDFYNQMSSEFQETLEERSPDEIAHDRIVLKELKKGRALKKALKLAGKKYPNEALQYTEDTIGDIESHYDYLLNHENIKAKIKQVSN